MAMRFILKLVLTIFFIPLFLLLLAGLSVRFQLLSPLFWENTYLSDGTYSKLSISINRNLESQTIAGGGKAGDIQILTELITPENLQNVIGKNIDNILQFANGKADEIIIYLPVNKIPEQLLSKDFGDIKEQMKLTDLLKEFNVAGIGPAQIYMVSRVGSGAWIFLICVILVLILVIYLLNILVKKGKRLVAPGIALVLGGSTALLVILSGTIIRINLANNFSERSNMGDVIIGIIAPPVIQKLLSYWLIFAIAAIIIGIALFFVKKQDYNKLKRKK